MKMQAAPAGKVIQLARCRQTHVRRNVQLDTRCDAESSPERSIDRRFGVGRSTRLELSATTLP